MIFYFTEICAGRRSLVDCRSVRLSVLLFVLFVVVDVVVCCDRVIRSFLSCRDAGSVPLRIQ